VRIRRNEELDLLGMRWIVDQDDNSRGVHRLKCKKDHDVLDNFKEWRRVTRRRNQTLYEDAQVTIFNRLKTLEAPEMAERFKYQLRNWILQVKEQTGKLPDIPKANVGGSRFFICPNQLSDEVKYWVMLCLLPS
jgi:chromatin segregation and condensation protein Rec8/ScpA/Scc1 (kleisin family)